MQQIKEMARIARSRLRNPRKCAGGARSSSYSSKLSILTLHPAQNKAPLQMAASPKRDCLLVLLELDAFECSSNEFLKLSNYSFPKT